MTRFLSVYTVAFLMAISFYGCKKDSDATKPSVVIDLPAENQIFNALDLVHVTASISDETKLTEVNISLVDENYTQKHEVFQLSVSSPSMSVNEYYWLSNIHLESGAYYIMVAASDGENIAKAYRKIVVQAVPRVIRKILLTTATGTSQTNLSYIDSTFSSIIPYLSFNGDFLASSTTSYYQQFNIAGKYSGAFSSAKLEDNTVKYSFPAVSSINPYYTGFYSDEQNTYVARFDGSIRGYNNGGGQIFSTSSNGGYYTENFTFNNGFLVAEQKYQTGSGRLLVSYNAAGTPLQQATLGQDVKVFCKKDDDNVFLFGNVAGQTIIQLYNISANNLWTPYPYTFPAGELLSAMRIDDDNYLFGHSNGTIYKYNYTSSSITSFLSGYTATKLFVDEVNSVLYIMEDNRVSTFAFPSMTPINTILSPVQVLDVNILYNR
jgi:hypothetical protein